MKMTLKTQPVDKQLILKKEILRERVYLRPKDKGNRGETDDDGESLYPRVRLATPADAKMIESWIHTQDEFRWLGGKADKSALPIRAQIASWIDSPFGGFILFLSKLKEIDDPNKISAKDQTSVAFINIDDFPEGPIDRGLNLEVGRLIVKPEWRWKGYGSTLIRHVTRVLGDTGIWPSINARVLDDNRIAQAMFNQLPFKKTDEVPPWEKNSTHKCIYYRYQLKRRRSRLGEQIARLRKERDNMTQAQAAFLCGLAPSMMNMIESGNRFPSYNTLQDIVSVLANNQQAERIELLLSILGESLEPSIRTAIDLRRKIGEEASPAKQRANYWIFSDRLLEDVDNNVFESTLNAIRSEFDRWYFVPIGYWDTQGEMLISRIRSAQLSGQSKLSESEIEQHVRFYSAPAALCALRILIRVPNLDSPGLGVNAVETSIGGEQADRFGIEKERSIALLTSVLTVVRNLESLAKDGNYRELEGFRQLFPRGKKP